MLKHFCLFIIAVSYFSCSKHMNPETPSNDVFKILFSNHSNTEVDAFLKDENIEKTIFINAGIHLDPDKDKQLNVEHYTKFLQRIAANRPNSKYIVLDWERLFKDLFTKDVNSEKSKDAFVQLEKCIDYGKEILPDKKWGIYNLPVSHYWNRKEAWKEKGNRAINLLKKVDVLYPSLYDFYKDDNPNAGRHKDELYIKDNLDFVFELNEILKKEIYVFVWHRWHVSNSKRPLYAIDPPEFRNHIATILSFEKHGKKIDGLVWWGSDKYFFNSKRKALLEEQKNFNDFDEYYLNLIKKYFSILHEEVKRISTN